MISIVCPFYNERENLTPLIERLLNTCRQFSEDWEIVLVDDASQDHGRDAILPFQSSEKRIRLIELEKNTGLTTALYVGLQESKGDVIATLDADLQNPPEELPKLIWTLRSGEHDMVTGYREKRGDSPFKKSISWIANHIRRSIIRDTIIDTGCSLRVFRRDVLKAFYPYKGMHRFFAPVAEAMGFKIKQIPVQHESRRFGKSKYGLWNRLLGPLWDLIAVRWLLTNKIHFKIRSQS